MPNRQQPRDPQQQKGRRKPMQTSPDDDEAQVQDQTRLGNDEETDRDETTSRAPTDRKRRALQSSQERESEGIEQVDDEGADDQEADDEDETTGRQ